MDETKKKVYIYPSMALSDEQLQKGFIMGCGMIHVFIA